MVISSRQKLQSLTDYTMNIHIDGVPINQSNQSKSLGLIIDENLSWKDHIHEISKKVSSGIGALKRVRPFVSMHTAIKIYKGLIEPHFDYCSAVLDGLTQQCINNLAPAYLCNLLAPRTPNYYFRNAKKKLMLPKPRTDNLKRSDQLQWRSSMAQSSWGNTYIKFLRFL